jgi:hypothetical protein
MTLPENNIMLLENTDNATDNITDFQHLSAEYFIHYLRTRFEDESPGKLKRLLKAAMGSRIRDEKIFDSVKTTLQSSPSIDEVTQVLGSTVNTSDLVESIIDTYMSVGLSISDDCSSAAQDLLRHLIFFPLPSSRRQFIEEFKASKNKAGMIPSTIWNAEDLNCVADYLDKKRIPK